MKPIVKNDPLGYKYCGYERKKVKTPRLFPIAGNRFICERCEYERQKATARPFLTGLETLLE